MSQVITLAQLQGAMTQNNMTAEQILAAGYECPEYAQHLAAQQAQAQVAVAGAAAPVGNFDLMAFAHTQVASASGSRRTPAWECTIEELRDRVIVRDLQTPGKVDEANAKLRLNLAPVYVALTAYGTLADGSPIVFFQVPRAHQAAAEAKLLADVKAGVHDEALLEAAQRVKESAEKKKENKGKRAPVDAAAAQAALTALETGALSVAGNVAVEAQPQVQLNVAQEPALQINTTPDLGGLTLPTI